MGAPRSGTTYLARLLEAHPDVVVVGEPRLVWRHGNDRRSDQLRPRHATAPVIDHIHRSLAAHLRAGGGVRLVEKTPANAVRPGFVEAVFPDARYVHITRDGWGAVPSMRAFWERRGAGMDPKQRVKLRRRLREASPSQVPYYLPELLRRSLPGLRRGTFLYGPRLAGLRRMAGELGYLEASALQWRTCVEHAATFGRALPAGRYLEMKLEHLDLEAVAAMLEFCGLAPADEVLDRFRTSYRVEAATDQAPLSADERRAVAPYVSAANAWLGYPAPSPSASSTPGGDVARSARRATGT